MKRIFFTFAAGAVLLASARLAAADQNGRHAAGAGFAGMRLERCLASLDLSPDVRSSIEAIVTAAKTTLQADRQALQADRQKLETDINAGADKNVLGQDVLTAHADRQKLKTDAGAVRDSIAGKLSADQQSQLKGCFHGPRAGASARPTS